MNLLFLCCFAFCVITINAISIRAKSNPDSSSSLETLTNEFSTTKYIKNVHLVEVTDPCHSLAVYRCGQRLITVNNILNHMQDVHSHQVRCVFKETFFDCLKQTRSNGCNDLDDAERQMFSSKHFQEDKFKRKLADTLVDFRMCTMSLSEHF